MDTKNDFLGKQVHEVLQKRKPTLYPSQFTTNSGCFIGVETTTAAETHFGKLLCSTAKLLPLAVAKEAYAVTECGSLSSFALFRHIRYRHYCYKKKYKLNFMCFILYLAISQQQGYQGLL